MKSAVIGTAGAGATPADTAAASTTTGTTNMYNYTNT
jgi:hypothetical protein